MSGMLENKIPPILTCMHEPTMTVRDTDGYMGEIGCYDRYY
jgi:hypothetical protein